MNLAIIKLATMVQRWTSHNILAHISTQLTIVWRNQVCYVFCVSLFDRFIASDCKFLRINLYLYCDCCFAINLFLPRQFSDDTHFRFRCANTCFDIQNISFSATISMRASWLMPNEPIHVRKPQHHSISPHWPIRNEETKL